MTDKRSMKTKTKKVKARRMWGAPMQGNSNCMWQTMSSKFDNKIFCDFTRPVFILPADSASYDAMVEQAGRALTDRSSGKDFAPYFKAVDESAPCRPCRHHGPAK